MRSNFKHFTFRVNFRRVFRCYDAMRKEDTMQIPYRVVIADDHEAYRQVIKRILGGSGELEVVGEAADGLQLIEMLSWIKPLPHLAVVDIIMPQMGGISATAAIKQNYPGMKVLVMSMHREKQYIDGALSAGADGYLLKENAHVDLSSALETIRRGGVYLSPQLFKEQ